MLDTKLLLASRLDFCPSGHLADFGLPAPYRPPKHAASMDALLDQSHLADLAEWLLDAARAAGADTADAVAVRSVSLSVDVREREVEESQRSEGDDIGLRVLVGRRQAVVSTNDVAAEGVKALAERAVAMARVAP